MLKVGGRGQVTLFAATQYPNYLLFSCKRLVIRTRIFVDKLQLNKMQFLFIFILLKIHVVYCQQTFLDMKFGPFFKNVQTFMVDLLKPKNFELQYQLNMRIGVSVEFK